MNAEQYISLADALRSRAMHDGADLNASSYLVHAALLRALRQKTLDQIAADTLSREFDAAKLRPE